MEYQNIINLLDTTSDRVTRPNSADRYDKKLAFKNNTPFISCI